jgi:hypothetical protein
MTNSIVMMRHPRETNERFLKELISLPRDSGAKMNADVRMAWIDLYHDSGSPSYEPVTLSGIPNAFETNTNN